MKETIFEELLESIKQAEEIIKRQKKTKPKFSPTEKRWKEILDKGEDIMSNTQNTLNITYISWGDKEGFNCETCGYHTNHGEEWQINGEVFREESSIGCYGGVIPEQSLWEALRSVLFDRGVINIYLDGEYWISSEELLNKLTKLSEIFEDIDHEHFLRCAVEVLRAEGVFVEYEEKHEVRDEEYYDNLMKGLRDECL